MDIDKMEAGPEMDALVAERVMGWKLTFQGHDWEDEENYYPVDEYRFSTDIAAAMPLIENETDFEIEKSGLNYTVSLISTMSRGTGKTLPLAICRAKLMAAEERDVD